MINTIKSLNTKTTLALLLPVQILLVKFLSFFPNFIEVYYSNGVYTLTSKLLRYTFGWLPLSFGDLIFSILTCYIIYHVIKYFKSLFKNPKSAIVNIFSFISILYFCFHVFWGFNYYRLPLHESLKLNHEYSTGDLVDVTKKLIVKTNAIHFSITKNDSLKVTVPYTIEEIFNKSANGFKQLSKQFPYLDYTPKSIKTSLYSLNMSYSGYSGYFNPFSGEAQVNRLIPLFNFPMVTCHEEAHQLGYAAENETNFIGFMAAYQNDDIYFKYSGYSFALRYCLREVRRRDKTAYETLLKEVNPGIIENYKELINFWDSYENPLEPLIKSTYDTFLKANNQTKGIKSYSYVVALIVNYDKKNGL